MQPRSSALSPKKIKADTNGAKVSDKDQVVINSEFAGPFKDTLKVADIASGQAVDVPVQYYSASEALPVLSRTRPTAYLVLPGHQDIEQKLKDQGLKSVTLAFKQNSPLKRMRFYRKKQRENLRAGQ
ncbi:hypothetical protein PO124_34325 [Bacillus licheniformis]|nr:hypothetical protein [Bacillus licheniformis]